MSDTFDFWNRLAKPSGIVDAETEAYARRSDPETSHDAAKSVRLSKLEAMVLGSLANFGEKGATASEICADLQMEWQTVSPRLAPLCRKGFAVDTERRKPGPSGRKQIVWRAT